MNKGEQVTWEYRTIEDPSTNDLEALGGDGWEFTGTSTTGHVTRLYFKRPHLSFREQVTLDQKRRYFAEWGLTATEEDGRPGE